MNIHFIPLSRIGIAASILCVALPISAQCADPVSELATSLQKAVEALSTRSQDQIKAALRTAGELDAAIKRSDARAVQVSAQQLSDMPWLPEEMRRVVERAQRELPRMMVAQREKFIVDAGKAVENTRTQCLAATQESDLSQLLVELTALRETQPGGDSNPSVARATRKIEASIKTTELWMNYVTAKVAGNNSQAVAILKQVENAMQNYPVLPAAELLGRIAEFSPRSSQRVSDDILAAFARINTLADVEKVGAEIEAMQSNSQEFNELPAAKTWFRNFRAATVSWLGGDFGDAWSRVNQANSDGGTWFPHTLRLRQMLLTELTPLILKLPPGQERRPDESYEDYINRQFADASQEGRWEDLRRMAVARNRASNSGAVSTWLTDLSFATGSFLEGRRTEDVGDFPAAILAYERVLRSTAEFAPVSAATERLKSLRQSHPEAFAEVHPRIESDQATRLIRQLEVALKQATERLAVLEADRKTPAKANTAAPAAAVLPAASAPVPSVSKTDYDRVEQRLKQAEETIRTLSTQNERLEKIEVLFGPGAEALGRDFDKRIRFRLWLGPDYTVYRSALPPKLEKGLSWEVHYNGKQVLGRNAENEFAYTYSKLKPGDYTIYLRGGGPGGDLPASNVISFTVPEGKAPSKRVDDDIDRDGVPNALEGK